MNRHLFTSESVTEGHPDKVCDQISDAILDAILAKDPKAHVACEVTATTGMVHVMGEITTECYVDIDSVARNVIKEIGYDNAQMSAICKMDPYVLKSYVDEYDLPKPTSDVHDYYRNFVRAIDGLEEQMVTHDQMRCILKVIMTAFESVEKGGDKILW